MQKDGLSDELEEFREELIRTGITKQRSILGTHRLGVSGFLSEGEETCPFFNKIRVFQALIDLKSNGSSLVADPTADPTAEQVFQQSCSLSELANEASGSHLLASPTYLAQALVTTRVQSSKFIDMPSGLLTVILKKLSHTSANFQAANFYMTVELKSAVPRNRVAAYSTLEELFKSQPLSFYKNVPAKAPSRKADLIINEAMTFLIRHYSDTLELKLHTQQDGLVFSTKIELNDIQLNQDKLSLTVVGTSHTRSQGNHFVYYTCELDLLFQPKLQSDPQTDSFATTMLNYQLLKGDAKMSKAAEEVIRMILYRMSLRDRIKNQPVFFSRRRAFFIARNMMNVSYKPIGSKMSPMNLVFRPKSFMMGQGFGQTQLYRASLAEEEEVGRALTQELRQGAKNPEFK